MTFDQYRELKAVNFSTLKHMARSPRHYAHAVAAPSEDTDALRIGRAIHAAVLEPEAFLAEYTRWDGDKRTKAFKEFAASASGRTILAGDEYDSCIAIRDAIRTNPDAAAILASGVAEQTIEWVDTTTGIKCKARLDWVEPGEQLADLKSARDVAPYEWNRAAAKYLLHVQAAWYRWGWHEAHGEWLPFSFIAAEKTPPYCVEVYDMEDEAFALGEETFKRWLATLADCRARNVWPGPGAGRQDIELPVYLFGASAPLEDVA